MTMPAPGEAAPGQPGPGEDELFIRLDVGGLASLLKAVEAAMIEGRGHLTLRNGGGIVATSSRSDSRYGKVTVSFVHHVRSRDEAGQPDPELQPREPVLEGQDA